MNSKLPQQRSQLRRLINRLEIDRAVFYAISSRIWQFFAGPITMLLIANYFTPQAQGYFYTFGSLLALQLFLEMGLLMVTTYFASHEWEQLSLNEQGQVIGSERERQRLTELKRFSTQWFLLAGLAFLVIVGPLGYVFFARDPNHINWQGPWITLILITSINFLLLPKIALLEGCHQVITVNGYRLLQSISGNLFVWGVIYFGGELWAAVVSAGIKLLWDYILTHIHYRSFWDSLPSDKQLNVLHWKSEIWPMQWRQSVNSTLNYFSSQLFNPIMFYYHGSVLAGQMGMTWTILIAIQAVSYAWVQTRIPLFGTLIAKKDYKELDRVFFRLTLISTIVISIISLAFCGCLLLINSISLPIAEKLASRLLSPIEASLFSLAVVIQHPTRCQSAYVLSHKRDPYLKIGLAYNLSCGAMIWWFGSQYGAFAAAVSYLLCVSLILVPTGHIIWLRCRREWHSDNHVSNADS